MRQLINMVRQGEELLKFARQSDPTQTLTLRRLFVSDINKRWVNIRKLINISIKKNDCFGLLKEQVSLKARNKKLRVIVPIGRRGIDWYPIPEKRFAFIGKSDQIGNFKDWYEGAVDRFFYSDTNWFNAHLKAAYSRGIVWARQKIKNDVDILKELNLTKDDVSTRPLDISNMLNQATHVDRLAAIYLRAYSDLEGITQATSSRISRILTEGILTGDNPRVLASNINKEIVGIGMRRSTLLARTETIRAHHLAAIQEYRNFGIEQVMVQAEWKTAGDSRVCELCAPLDGEIYSLSTIEGMIPRHPQCRCAALPYLPELKEILNKKLILDKVFKD